jgi:hypothetical protein
VLTEYSELQESDVARFWNFVPQGDPNVCWEWQSVRNHRGYGKFWLHGRTDLAHRVSYRIDKGLTIPAGKLIRHTCDNPPCVNPTHLLVGTVRDNSRDQVERGRSLVGVANPRAKLTPERVREIRTGWNQGETQVSLARRFGVSRAAVQWVLNGRNWTHVGDVA